MSSERRPSDSSLFARVFDIDDESVRPSIRLCNLILREGLFGRWRRLTILPPDASQMAQLRADLEGSSLEVMKVPTPMHGQLVNRLRVMANLDRTGGRPILEGEIRVAARGEEHHLKIVLELAPGGEEQVTVDFPERT